jgi:hypothetical protein
MVNDYEKFLLAAGIAMMCPRMIVANQSFLRQPTQKRKSIVRTTRSRTRSGNIVEEKQNQIFNDRIKTSNFVPCSSSTNIPQGQFWNHVNRDCEIFPTVIPLEHRYLYWFNLAFIFGSHYPNQWLERKTVLNLVGTAKNHSMRGCLIPRATTISAFFPPLETASIDPPMDSLIMMKTGNLHYFMVWNPISHDICPGFTSGCKCPNPGTCPIKTQNSHLTMVMNACPRENSHANVCVDDFLL